MKKFYLFILSAILLSACSSEDGSQGGDTGGSSTKQTPSTQVYVMGQLLNNYTDFNSAKSVAFNSQVAEKAYYYIRIDNRIPGMGSCPSDKYFPAQWNGQSMFVSGNQGTIKADYPYWKSLDASIDKYIYDTSGNTVEQTLGTVPSLQSLIDANRYNPHGVYLGNLKTDTLKVIWYVSKREAGVWHVDGVLTGNSTKDITEVPGVEEDKDLDNSKDEPTISEYGKGNIEVDIHQQEHNTWDEIKTSIHVRDLVDKVVVEIPIDNGHIAESDDFALRVYDFNLESKVFINGTEYVLDDTNPVKINVAHEATKVVITVECKNKSYLDALRKEYGDGVTVEVHTYPKDLSKAEVWSKVKNSVVKVIPESYKGLIYKGATSAFFKN